MKGEEFGSEAKGFWGDFDGSVLCPKLSATVTKISGRK